jgi:hypothetical protein
VLVEPSSLMLGIAGLFSTYIECFNYLEAV